MENRPPSTKKGLQSLLVKIKNFEEVYFEPGWQDSSVFSINSPKKEEFQWKQEHQMVFDEINEYLMHPLILFPPVRNKCIRLYIYASNLTIGSMLTQEDDNSIEMTIYHLI